MPRRTLWGRMFLLVNASMAVVAAALVIRSTLIIHLSPADTALSVGSTLVIIAAADAIILLGLARALRPLSVIVGAAKRLERGAEDIDLDVATGDELEEVADALSRGARALAEAWRSQREQQAMLVQAEKLAAVGSLTAGVAHEVNNPLAYILTNEEYACEDLEGVSNDPRVPGEVRQLVVEDLKGLRSNLQGLHHIQRIVASLRELSRQSHAQRDPVDLAAVAQSALVLASDRARKRGVKLMSDLPGGLVAPAAKEEIGQVLLNLLLNGVDAAGTGGRVRISGRLVPNALEFRVHDTGPGIPPEVQPRLFRPFFTTKKDGTGLGLSISEKIVKEHRGSIEFQTGPGRGTEFVVRLPRAGVDHGA